MCLYKKIVHYGKIELFNKNDLKNNRDVSFK